MPQFETKTTEAESVWKSPDGQREIFKVILDIDGKPLMAKTYSKDISSVGWTGTVETYEKQGRNGSETFVKQPPKEGFSGGGGFSKGGFKPQGDQFTMYLSYAKDIAVAMVKDGKLDENAYAQVLDAVSTGGHTLYDSRPGATPGATPAEEKPADKPVTTKLDEIFTDMGDMELGD